MAKDKKKDEVEDTDSADEIVGVEGKEKPLARRAFLDMLSKISRPLAKPSDKGKSKTSE